MLSKLTVKFLLLLLVFSGCGSCNQNTKAPTFTKDLLKQIEQINQSSDIKDLINDDLDLSILKEINNQTATDSTRYLLKINVQDKYLYTFPIKRSKRLNYHIYRLDNAEEVYVGLEGQFNNYFYDSRFNKDAGIAKFYFEQHLPDTTLQRFLTMCVLDDYQIIEIN